MKEQWITPKLIVLARGNPEELVLLSTCKNQAAAGVSNSIQGCNSKQMDDTSGTGSVCNPCHSI